MGLFRLIDSEHKSLKVQLFPIESEELADIYSLPPLAAWVTYRQGRRNGDALKPDGPPQAQNFFSRL